MLYTHPHTSNKQAKKLTVCLPLHGKNSCNLTFKGSAFKVYLSRMPLGHKQRLGSTWILPAPRTSALSNYEEGTVQGNCCCYGTSGRGATPKVIPEQTPGWAPAAWVKAQKPGSCCIHVPHAPKSRGEAVGTRQCCSTMCGATSTCQLQRGQCFPIW